MTADCASLIETLIEGLIETSIRLQASLRDEVPESVNGDVLRCGELLAEIRQQASMAELIVGSPGRLKARLGYLREILDANEALVRQGAAYGEFALKARAGAAEGAVYSVAGLAETKVRGGALLSAKG